MVSKVDVRAPCAYLPPMPRSVRFSGVLLMGAVLLAVPGLAEAQRAAAGPRAIGTFGAWTAATVTESGHKVCYALARANRPGSTRDAPTLTVSHRPDRRDQVAFQGGSHRFARNATATVKIGDTDLAFYTHADTAYARDNAAAIAAMRAGREAVATVPGANGRGTANETFSLSGFTAAYEAISRECPASRR